MKYDDIISLPRPESGRPKMSLHDRAAQFSAFAALNGHEEAIDETARRVERKLELSEDEKAELDMKMRMILEVPERMFSVTFFVRDKKKSGGAYVTKRGFIKAADELERKLVLTDLTEIPFDDVSAVESDIFT